ncbi:MAG: recombination regulator RecX [Lonepinella koalarum]|nr:recombination regulator RecX [Lonepinella koalarum]
MASLALNYIIGLLARREHSEFEIRCKMQQKAFSEEEIEQVILHCQQKGWQNDKRFAENFLRFRASKGYGANRIRQELVQLKGVSSEIIDEVLIESEIDWSEIALSVLSKKFPIYRQKQSPKDKQKIWRYMLSHGFYSEEFADFVGNLDDE